MKNIATILLLCITFLSSGQDIISLDNVKTKDTISKGQAVFYGNFIQRLGFSSGGFPQDIRLIDINTNEIYTFRVKPTYKSAKENPFFFFIKPGTYAILNYYWTQSKWYGGKTYIEPIYKGIDMAANLEKETKSVPTELQQFTFSVYENTLNYLGTWHFDKGVVSFTDDKPQMDENIKSNYPKFDFSNAKVLLPN